MIIGRKTENKIDEQATKSGGRQSCTTLCMLVIITSRYLVVTVNAENLAAKQGLAKQGKLRGKERKRDPGRKRRFYTLGRGV